MNVTELTSRTVDDLRGIARDHALVGYSKLKKQDLIDRLLKVPPAIPAHDEEPIQRMVVSVADAKDAATVASAVAVESESPRLASEEAAVRPEAATNGAARLIASDLVTNGMAVVDGAATPALEQPSLVEAQTDLEVRPVEHHEEHIFSHGVLDVSDAGHGFLRPDRFLPGPDDVYVSQSQIRRFGLRTGDMIAGQVRPPKDNERYFSLLRVEAVNGQDPESAVRRPVFEALTPIFPHEQLNLETTQQNLSQRLINLVAPIGRGQRGLVVSPPKAGKTMILKHIANGITANHPEIHLMVCLIGERPEEVTDMKRSVQGEVISSTFDEDTENHTKVAEMALERAKRLVEAGRDVVILLDSITRLVRAYNLAVPPSGRTLTGGVDPSALYPPKRFFGAARKLEEGGSLTCIATCLVDTGSRMDEVVYEEFKGTGNLEVHLERRLAERRVFPAIDVLRSSTRREELLLDETTLRQVWMMRRMLGQIGEGGIESLLRSMSRTANNREFLRSLSKEAL